MKDSNIFDSDIEALHHMLRHLREPELQERVVDFVDGLLVCEVKDHAGDPELRAWAEARWLSLGTLTQKLYESLQIFEHEVREHYAQRFQAQKRIEHMKHNASLTKATYPMKDLYP